MLQPMFNLSVQRPAELVIRNVPPHIVRRLRERAAAHERSLQDELYAILELAVSTHES